MTKITKDIQGIETKDLEDLARRYEERKLTEGGIFSLREVKIELARRLAQHTIPTRALFDFIVCGVAASPDHRLTYLEVWENFHPGQEWKGNHSIKIVGKALGAVIGYCHESHLPIVTVCVVQKGSGSLSEQAEENIFNEARAFGVNVGSHSPRSFCEAQREATIALARLSASTAPAAPKPIA